jgi:hypothetical protein
MFTPRPAPARRCHRGWSPRSQPLVWRRRRTSRGAGHGLMVVDFSGGSSRHDLHLLGVVRPVNEMIRATVVRELLGNLLCGAPRRDGSASNTRPRSLTSGCTRTTGHSILGVAFHCDGMCLHDHQPRPSFTATRAGCPRERREKAQG